MPNVRLAGNRLEIGDRFSVSFQRTLRIPDDGKIYPLPPGLGLLPVHGVADHRVRAPREWSNDEFFVGMYQREALWLGFDGASWKPNAAKIGVGGIDAISGEAWTPDLVAEPQNYIVAPDQPWLDGINAGSGFIRQFVAMPLGRGYTVEGQLTGEERTGGIQLRVFEPVPGRFSESPPPYEETAKGTQPVSMSFESRMGLASGGRMRQAIYRDRYGINAWDQKRSVEVRVHIVNSADYVTITGRPAPPPPIDARTYTEYGLPWFELYDGDRADVPSPERLAGVRSTGEIDQARTGRTSDDAASIDVRPGQVQKVYRRVDQQGE